jgi:HEAT repeat protein
MTVVVQSLLAAWSTATQSERMAHLQRVATHGRPAVELLISYLSSPNPAIRLAAVEAVGSLGDRFCLPAVQNLLNDSDPGVAQTAQWAVGVLQGR